MQIYEKIYIPTKEKWNNYKTKEVKIYKKM